VRGMDGADPASVVYDGIASAKKAGTDVIIIDTAGRLQNKDNLMQELRKIRKIIAREMPSAAVISIIVIDANTGKNAYSQAAGFNEAIGLSGIILTKMDSTSKGGCVITVRRALGVPVLYYTFGEAVTDIDKFDPEKFVDRIFGEG